jgi:hypothetical protein
MTKLVISENPSVAVDFAKALGAFTNFDDKYKNNEYVIG